MKLWGERQRSCRCVTSDTRFTMFDKQWNKKHWGQDQEWGKYHCQINKARRTMAICIRKISSGAQLINIDTGGMLTTNDL